MMSKKFLYILIVLSFVLAALIVGLVKLWSTDKKLIDYLPVEAAAYFEFQPRHKQLEVLSENNFRASVRLKQLIQQSGLWGPFNQKFLADKIDQLGLIILNKNDNQQTGQRAQNKPIKIWLIQTTQADQITVLLPKDFYVVDLTPKIIAVSQKYDYLKLVKQPRLLSSFTPTQRVILTKFNERKFLNVYLSRDYLQNILQQPSDLKTLILDQLDFDPQTPAYFSLRADKQQVILNFQAAGLESQKSTALRSVDYQFIKTLVGPDLFLVLEVANLQNVVKELESYWQDQLSGVEIEQQKKILAEKYDFDWNDFKKLTSHPAILFSQHQIKRPMFQELLNKDNLNYGLAVKVGSNTQTQELYAKLKHSLSYYLAFLYPSPQKVKLADGSEIIVKTADPQSINWQTSAGVDFFEQANTQVAMAQKNGIIYISLDKELLIQILKNQNQNDKLKNCPNFTGQQIIYFKTQRLSQGLLSYIDDLLIISDEKDSGINLKGCMVW